MITTTTHSVEGRTISAYLGVVTGEVIVGANIFRDLFAGIRDIVGGRAGSYENVLRDARRTAFAELEAEAGDKGAHAVVGIAIAYEESAEARLGGKRWVRTGRIRGLRY